MSCHLKKKREKEEGRSGGREEGKLCIFLGLNKSSELVVHLKVVPNAPALLGPWTWLRHYRGKNGDTGWLSSSVQQVCWESFISQEPVWLNPSLPHAGSMIDNHPIFSLPCWSDKLGISVRYLLTWFLDWDFLLTCLFGTCSVLWQRRGQEHR